MPQPIERAPSGATHELKELEVYEVSLVDRPANKRDFLVVKRDTPMKKGEQLHDDGSGELSPEPTEKEFSAGAKKKIKSALTKQLGKLNKLLESIEDAADEVATRKAVAGIGASLSKFAPANTTDKSTETTVDESDTDPAPTPDPAPSPAPTAEAVKALAAKTAPQTDPAQLERQRKQDARDTKVEQQLGTLTKAVHTLADIAIRKNSGGPRPASAGKPTGETIEQPSQPVWRSDMNSDGIPDDEQFV
jgi:hypothetical protein